MKNKLNLLIMLSLIIGIGLACSGSIGNQQADANKLVDEANKQLEEARTLMTKTDERSQELFGAKLNTVGELKAYKEKMKNEAKEITENYEKVAETLKEISKKYDEASRLNVSEKYKEYTKIKSEEFIKRAEAIKIHKGNAQAFVEISEPKQMFEKFEENNKKSAAMFKEAEEMSEKAKKIETENKEIFKTT